MYLPLNIKTEYTLLNSMIKIKDLVSFAKKNNIKALTITDDNMFGVMEFYKECRLNDIKPVIGLNLKKFNLVLYAKNARGYQNLLKLSTKDRDLTLKEEDLKKYHNDLICIIPFSNKNNIDNYSYYKDIFIGFKNQEEEELLGLNKVYMDEILYLEKEDATYLDYLDAIRCGMPLNKGSNNNQYLKLEKDLPFDLENNKKIASMCNIDIPANKDLIPKYKCPNNMDSYTYLKELSIRGLKKLFGTSVSIKYKERLKYELEVIHKMGFDDYFLIVYDYVNFARNNNILVGPGRGSAAGSLVSYLLGIIKIDPIKYDLIFERFLNENRITLPDIDIDFDGSRKQEVIDYCINKYGSKRVSGIITFVSLGSKQVLKDVARVMDKDLEEVDFLCRMIDSKMSLSKNYKLLPKIRRELESNKDLKEVYDIALHLEGLKKTTSVHASGIVMCNDDLDLFVPLEKHDNMYLTGYSMNYLEELGLLKMDFLSLTTLTTIKSIMDDIGSDISLDDIPLDDEKTMDIFKNANTLGIFQFESQGIIQMLQKLKPRTFEDIYNSLALYRPGPMHNIDTFINRRNKKEKIDFYNPALVPILKSTYGIILYQEQIMKIANVMAGYTLGEADILRRAMSKKKEEILIKEKDKFVNRSIERGYSEKLSNYIYNLILKFAEYGFNKSHSVAYAYISFQMAYLKAHYPNYFIRNLLSTALGSDKTTRDYINECRNNHINIINPDINKSENKYIIENSGIRYPLSGIKGITVGVVSAILTERDKGLFKDIYDFLIRIDKKIVNKRIILILNSAGCFDSFNLNRKTIFNNLDVLFNYAELVNDLGDKYTFKPDIDSVEEYSKKEIASMEYECFGFYLNNNPISEYRKKYKYPISINNIPSYASKYITLIVFIDDVKEYTNKKNEKMCFLTVSDSYATLNVIVFNNTYKETEKISKDDVIILTGRVEFRKGRYQVVANKIKVIRDN